MSIFDGFAFWFGKLLFDLLVFVVIGAVFMGLMWWASRR
jgi:type IV secretory pathway VirB2 component (pilin)